MKRCPSCRRVYDRDAAVCQADGAALADFNIDPVVTDPVVTDPAVGQTLAKRYRVLRKLGDGPLGTVYLGKELATGNTIALKILVKELQCDDEALTQCRWDTRFATASQPSRVVRVFEVNRTDEGQVFIAMEYLEGENLADIIRRAGALEFRRALRLTRQIAQGLAAASRAGVPHRDLKPQNVVVYGPDERVKLTDFGIARLWRTTMDSTRTRLDGVTLEYAAPEQLIGGDADDRTDVYGLGALLYAMLAGAAPPTDASRDLARAPRRLREMRPEVPVALEQALLRALEREPARRQNGMQEFAESLLELAATVLESETPQGVTPALRERAREPSPLASPKRAHASRERPPAYRTHRRERRARWRAQLHAYRVRFQAYRERRHAGRLAYRAQLEAQRHAAREQRHAARLAYRSHLEAQRHAARERRHARWLRWQAQWRVYRTQFQSYRARRQARWLAYRTQLEAYRASFRSYREGLQTALRSRWWSRLERTRSSLGELTGRLIALASLPVGNGLRWGHANGGRLSVTGVAALVVVGAIAWAAPDRRPEPPAPVQNTAAKDSGSVGEQGASSAEPVGGKEEPIASRNEPAAVGMESEVVTAEPSRPAASERSGVVNRTPSAPVPAGESPKHPRRIPPGRHQQAAASPRLIVPPAAIEPVAAMEPESLRPPPPSSIRPE
jgi:predicted Ser/Thr protein kinase